MSAYEVLTEHVQDSPEWHEARRSGVGASEVPAILGLTPPDWGFTALSVYMYKKGVQNDIPENLAFFGHALEEPIAQWVAQKRGLDVRAGMSVRSNVWEWLTATPDRMVATPEGLVPLELKTSSAYSKDKWAEGVPLHYQAQVQTQIAVLDVPFAYLAVLHGGNDPELYTVERDDQFIAEHLIPKTRAFWFDHVLADVAPEPTTLAEVADVYPSEPRELVGSELVLEAAEQRAVILSDMAALKEQADAFTLAIAQYLGTADTLTREDGTPVLTYKTQRGRKSVSVSELEKQHPEIAAQLVKQGDDFKVMRMSKENKK